MDELIEALENIRDENNVPIDVDTVFNLINGAKKSNLKYVRYLGTELENYFLQLEAGDLSGQEFLHLVNNLASHKNIGNFPPSQDLIRPSEDFAEGIKNHILNFSIPYGSLGKKRKKKPIKHDDDDHRPLTAGA